MTDTDRHIRPFAEWMLEQREGLLANELAEGLNELVEAVTTHGKGGTLKLEIKIEPANRAQGMVNISDTVTVKAPTGERPASLFFVTPDANLSRVHPSQLSFEMHEVPRADPDTGEIKPRSQLS